MRRHRPVWQRDSRRGLVVAANAQLLRWVKLQRVTL
jgi:hypothetical protein